MKPTVKVIWVVGIAISTETLHAQEIFVQGGTLGIGVGAALNINSRFGVHADFNAFKLSHDFTVGGKLLPKGVYSIKKNSENIILIRSRNKPISTLAMVTPDGHSAPGGGVLTFHRYGDQYFLSQILSDSANLSRAYDHQAIVSMALEIHEAVEGGRGGKSD